MCIYEVLLPTSSLGTENIFGPAVLQLVSTGLFALLGGPGGQFQFPGLFLLVILTKRATFPLQTLDSSLCKLLFGPQGHRFIRGMARNSRGGDQQDVILQHVEDISIRKRIAADAVYRLEL